jgi:hypothetical protein
MNHGKDKTPVKRHNFFYKKIKIKIINYYFLKTKNVPYLNYVKEGCVVDGNRSLDILRLAIMHNNYFPALP